MPKITVGAKIHRDGVAMLPIVLVPFSETSPRLLVLLIFSDS